MFSIFIITIVQCLLSLGYLKIKTFVLYFHCLSVDNLFLGTYMNESPLPFWLVFFFFLGGGFLFCFFFCNRVNLILEIAMPFPFVCLVDQYEFIVFEIYYRIARDDFTF